VTVEYSNTDATASDHTDRFVGTPMNMAAASASPTPTESASASATVDAVALIGV
ncbi:unnamed protein product, partial [Ceratitis capitata]